MLRLLMESSGEWYPGSFWQVDCFLERKLSFFGLTEAIVVGYSLIDTIMAIFA